MPAITPITMPAIPPPERPEFDAEGVKLAVFVAELGGRVYEEKLEEFKKEDKDVLIPRIMVEMISGVPGSDYVEYFQCTYPNLPYRSVQQCPPK
jgi:hypothetical protein